MSSGTPKTGKKPNRAARAKIAEQRARQARADRRRRILTVVGSVIGIAAIVGALVAIKVTQGSGTKSADTVAVQTAPSAVVQSVTSVPAAVADKIGAGSAKGGPKAVTGDKLTKSGKPEILYVGAEYCPYCAGERWALTEALSRFGTFDGLKTTTSSLVDKPAGLHTFTYRDAKYTSDYVAFTPVETATSNVKSGSYEPLHKLTDAQQKLVTKYNSSGGIPFIDYANQYVSEGAGFDINLLQGLTWQQIADKLDQPDTDVAKAINGSANVITATICKLTNDQPANVCGGTAIKDIEKQIDAAAAKK